MSALELLSSVASQSNELVCLCRLKRKSGVAEVQLVSRANQQRVEVSLCEEVDGAWVDRRERPKSLRDGLAWLTRQAQGKVVKDSLRHTEKRTPLKGKDLDTVYLAALVEAFEGKLPASLAGEVERLSASVGSAPAAARAAPAKKAPAKKKAAPPPGLERKVKSEPPLLAKQREALARKWSLTTQDGWSRTREVLGQLVALGRDAEALELAEAMIAAAPSSAAAKHPFFWFDSVVAAAVKAHLGERRGVKSARKDFEARLGDAWEVAEEVMIAAEVLNVANIAKNARFHPGLSALTSAQLLGDTLCTVLFRQRLASVKPYSGWYSAKTLEPTRESLVAGIRERLGEKMPKALAGATPLDVTSYDLRLTSLFEVEGAPERRTAPCAACGERLAEAKCWACGAWYVLGKGAEPAKLCVAHRPARWGTVVPQAEAALKQRRCTRCKKVGVRL